MNDPAPLPITGVVLAGGEGRRMGGPKAFLCTPDGRALVDVALDALRDAGASALAIAARDAAPFAGTCAAHGASVVLDRTPSRATGLGPLAGFEAALEAAATAWTLVVACDMPRLDPALLRRIATTALAQGDGALAVVPRVEGRAQPLHAAYHRRALPIVSAALDAGRLRVSDLVAALDPLWLDLPPDASFVNWNTPEDRK